MHFCGGLDDLVNLLFMLPGVPFLIMWLRLKWHHREHHHECGTTFPVWLANKGACAWAKGWFRTHALLILIAHTLEPSNTSIKGPGADYYRWWERKS